MKICFNYLDDKGNSLSADEEEAYKCEFSISKDDSVSLTNVSIYKKISSLSVDLLSDLVRSKMRNVHIIYKDDNSGAVLQRIHLSGCTITHYSLGAEDQSFQEKICLTYDVLEVHSVEHDDGGDFSSVKKFGYDISKKRML